MRLDVKRILLFIIVGFVILSIWNNPTGTAQSFSTFLGDVGGWVEDVIDRATAFFRGLTD